MIGVVRSTLGAQPSIFPSRVPNRKSDGPDTPFSVTMNWLAVPRVGMTLTAPATGGASLSCGIVTTVELAVPSPPYRVDVRLPWLATHTGVFGPNTSPQGLRRFGST